MRNRFRGKDYLAFKDMSREEIEFIVDLSLDFKKKWAARASRIFKRAGMGSAV